jgi:anaerobic ribonucleoside-triphosphate reductase activating protein
MPVKENTNFSPFLFLNRLHYPVLTLGYGKRVGIWFQGCSIHCPGCLVPDTWKAGLEHQVPVFGVLKAMEKWLPNCDGVTISGGEPFDQPEALLAMVLELRRRKPALDLLVYSGYTFDRLQERHNAILQAVDVIVAGPFIEKLEDPRPFVGSANQTIHLLSDLAHKRYENAEFARGFTIDYQDGAVYMAGVPKRGEMEQLERALQ